MRSHTVWRRSCVNKNTSDTTVMTKLASFDSNGDGVVDADDIDFDRLGTILQTGCPKASFIPEIWQGHKNGGEGFWIAMERLEGKL